ncbi:MAG TPA: hypothetical protein DCG19_09870 [Cryomorphaceae bacterium]|nr:hypothetical protein [Owenweeksia sp.]MBF98621.1 hypothetical protein [Owenweeksia sp.]HAD97701.1 hypothetical protein [Cryomorphaceae bacterium]|tara:strand:+ start:8416 stop:9846 length:1431 start_codon:yes stop_codon:yes gene_type:complete
MTAENGSFYTFGADYIGPEPFKSTGEFHIRKYDIETLDLQSDIELNEFEFEGNETWFRKVIRTKNGIHTLFESHDPKRDVKYLLHRKLGVKGFTSLSKVIATSNQKYQANDVFTPYFSRDSSKVLIYADKESSSSDVIPHIYILNGNFESIWDAPLSLSSDKKGIKPMGITLSNNGAVYLLALADNGKINERDFTNTNYLIYKIDQKGSKVIHDFSQYPAPIHNGMIQANMQGKLLFFAFIEDDSKASRCLSLFFDQTNDKLISENQIDLEEFGQGLQANRNNLFASLANIRGLQRISFENFFEWKDGSMTLLAEQYYQHGYEADPNTTFEAQNIMAITLNQSGDLKSAYIIPKSADVAARAYSNINYYSYMAEKKDDEVQIFYNTHGENLEQLGNSLSIKHNFGTFKMDIALVQANLNPEEGVTYHELNRITTSSIKKTRFLDTDRYLRIGSNQYIILYAPSLYKFGFAKIKTFD